MKLAKYLTSDESPLVLQIVVPVAPDNQIVNRSVKALSLLADQVCLPKNAWLTYSNLVDDEVVAVTKKVGALPPGTRRSPDRMKQMLENCGDDCFSVECYGWEHVIHDGKRRERMHYSCNGNHDRDVVVRAMSYAVMLVVRFEDLVTELHAGWRDFALRACRAVVANGPIRSGIIDIIETKKCAFGDPFLGHRRDHNFLRSTLWSRWVASARRGESKVPWPSPAAVVAAEAIRRCGGLDAFSREMWLAARDREFDPEGPVVDPLPDGSAIVWLAPDFHKQLPRNDDQEWMELDCEVAERTASMYRRLQEMGLAL